MFEFLGFGRARKTKEFEKQREVIRLALNSVLRRRGIAPQSIDCELTPLSRSGGADVTLVQLLILEWHEALMRDASDLENELFDVICLYGRSSKASDFLFAWKFALNKSASSNKPLEVQAKATVPEAKSVAPSAPIPAVAAASATAVVATAPATPVAPPAKFDLPKTARDQESDQGDYGFPPTMMVDSNE
jgi:hypothetical protein